MGTRYIKDPLAEQVWADELAESRYCYKREMLRVVTCFDNADKIKLLKEWQKEYSPIRVQGLLACAKDPKARVKVANWDLNNFDYRRIGKHG